MPHSQSFHAIVLKTYDVGEADRLCVLFTRERGRLLARAAGARRVTSRLGGALLPFRCLQVELKEGSGGWVVAGATREGFQGVRRVQGPGGVDEFMMLEEGIELLLRFVTDEGALPEVFDATLAFIDICHGESFGKAQDDNCAVLSYSFCLLHHLGLLPGEEEMKKIQELSPSERGFFRTCRSGNIIAPDSSCNHSRLTALRSFLLGEQLSSPLKAADVVAAMT